MALPTDDRKTVFISYSHKDDKYLQDLRSHLGSLEQKYKIDFWDDTRIAPGVQWHEEIKRSLDSAKVAILLISPNYLASDFLTENELPPLLENASKDSMTLLPVILTPSAFKHTPLAHLQTVNSGSIPLSQMSKPKRDEVWNSIAERISNAFTSTDIHNHTTSPSITSLYTYQGHTERVNAIAWSPDGTRLASASDDKTVQIWDTTTGRRIVTYKGHHSFVFTIAWSPDGQFIASAGNDQQLHIWNATTKRRFASFSYSKAIAALAWAPDGKCIAFASTNIWPTISENDTLQVIDISRQNTFFSHEDHFRTAAALSWSPDGQFIASASYGGMIEVIDIATKTILYTYQADSSQVNTLTWSPKGTLLASAGDDSIVGIWNTATKNTISTYQGHTGPVSTISWSPDGQFIASAGEGQTVQIWNLTTRECIWTYHGHTGPILTVSWSPDGQRVASAGQDKIVHIWHLDR